MHAIAIARGVAARQLEGRGTVPAVGRNRFGVVAGGVAELRHALHALGALIGGRIAEGVLGDVVRVDAVGEFQGEAEMLLASLGGHFGTFWLMDAGGLLAVPFQFIFRVIGLSLSGGTCFAREHGEVPRDRDLGEGGGVIGAEGEDGYFGKFVTVDVVESGDPLR